MKHSHGEGEAMARGEGGTELDTEALEALLRDGRECTFVWSTREGWVDAAFTARQACGL